jgi:D-alanyl-D-alanine carboxypeptidase (penicillin-binding protein 5/6)
MMFTRKFWLCLILPTAMSFDLAQANLPSVPTIQPTPPSVAAKAYYLVDADTGALLASQNSDEELAPASLTKLMTLYITFSALQSGQLKLDDMVTISKEAWQMSGSRMFLKPDTRVSVSDLLQGVIVDSGNDACEALAEHIAGDDAQFANIMNDSASKLGMQHSHFLNPTGLPDPGHYSSSRDLGILAGAIIKQFPEYYPYFSQKWFTYNNIKQPNRDRLLWRDSSVDGLKTGHTDSAGYCLVSSAKRDKMRLIAVVMGANSDAARANIAQTLLNFGFRFYKTYELFPANKPLSQARVWLGKQNQIGVGLIEPLAVTIRLGDYNKLQAKMNLNPNIKAPIEQGQALGDLTVSLDGQLIGKAKLVALQSDKKAGIVSRTFDHLKLGMKHIF